MCSSHSAPCVRVVAPVPTALRVCNGRCAPVLCTTHTPSPGVPVSSRQWCVPWWWGAGVPGAVASCMRPRRPCGGIAPPHWTSGGRHGLGGTPTRCIPPHAGTQLSAAQSLQPEQRADGMLCTQSWRLAWHDGWPGIGHCCWCALCVSAWLELGPHWPLAVCGSCPPHSIAPLYGLINSSSACSHLIPPAVLTTLARKDFCAATLRQHWNLFPSCQGWCVRCHVCLSPGPRRQRQPEGAWCCAGMNSMR